MVVMRQFGFLFSAAIVGITAFINNCFFVSQDQVISEAQACYRFFTVTQPDCFGTIIYLCVIAFTSNLLDL